MNDAINLERLRETRDADWAEMHRQGYAAGRRFASEEASWHLLQQIAEAGAPDHPRLVDHPEHAQTVFERIADPSGLYMTAAMWAGFWTTWAGLPIVPHHYVLSFWQACQDVYREACERIGSQ